MHKILFLISFLSLSSTLAETVARVGSKEIDSKELDEKHAMLREQLVEVPDKKTLLEDMINFEVGVQEAFKRGLDKDSVIHDRMMQELYKGFIERELAPKTTKMTASESEMKNYYSKFPEIRASHIMIEVRSDATADQRKEVRKRALEIYDSVKKSSRKFEDLAKIYSDDVMSNKSGGDIGWQTRMTLYPSIYKSTAKLSVGDITPLLETPFGFFILKLTGKKSYPESDHAMLRLAVLEEKKKILYDQFIAGIRNKYKVQINKNAL